MSWGQGYVTEVDYLHGFYREMSPTWLRSIAGLQNVTAPTGPLTYLELGAGQGYGINLLAAANPNDRFIGVDFNPAHVVGAGQLAAMAELDNVEFLERGFEELVAEPEQLPDCDVIALHGVYSWVGPDQREAIRSIIRSKLKPGGHVDISYNSMAGWGPLTGFQKTLRDLTLSRRGDPNRISGTLQQLKALRDAGLGFFKNNAAVNTHLDTVAAQNQQYIAHEYMTEHWTPFFFQDVFDDMADCKLGFVGSARPAENVDGYSLPKPLIELIQAETDPRLGQSLRDLAVGRRFRKDVFARGVVRRSREAWLQLIGESRIMLTQPRGSVEMKASLPIGTLQMGKPIYQEVLRLLEAGPGRLKEITQDPRQMVDLLTVLMETEWLHPCSSAPAAAAKRFNRAISSSPFELRRYGYAASPMLGSGVMIKPEHRAAFSIAAHTPGIPDGHLVDELGRRCSDPAFANLVPAKSDASPEPDLGAVLPYLAGWRQLDLVD